MPPPRILSLTADDLRRALLLEPFDGRGAQRLMEPVRRGPRPPDADRRPARQAAALAYVFERSGRLRLPLTLRREDLPEHRGQVSLPGGRPQGGETLWATALREADEEVGLRPHGLERLGVLAPVYIPITHTQLHVHVALGPDPGDLEPCPREVERIVIVDVGALVAPANRRVTHRLIDAIEVDVPYFDVEGLFLWGATAMGLSELVVRLRSVVDA